jgi:hypothetical protein
MPGKIFEKRQLIEELKLDGISAYEQILFNDAKKGDFWAGYSKIDINRINNLPDDWELPIHKESVYQDPRIPPVDNTPSYNGMGCYSGIDYLYISHKGYASGSDCGGRDIGNVFDANWAVPGEMFTCNMNYCRSDKDRRLLRVGVSI